MKITTTHQESTPYREALIRELVGYNDLHGPPESWEFIGFYALDEKEQLVGGLHGHFEWDWLHVTHLWVRDRRQGLGQRLLEVAEAFAKQREKRGLFLDTFEFQAKPFYEKMGFVEIGKIENAAGSYARYFMSKQIISSQARTVGTMTTPRLRPATRADLQRIHQVRHGTVENRLRDPALVTDEEVAWYMDEAIFLVSEDETDVQGFICANHQTGYVWALFVVDEAQGRGHGTALLDAVVTRFREAGHRQALLSTSRNTRAAEFYKAKGWHATGTNLNGEAVFRLWL